MKIATLTASLVALSLFTFPTLAEEQGSGAAPFQVAATAVPTEVQALLDDKRPVSELSVQELRQRIRQARGFLKSGELSGETKRSLRSIVSDARKELDRRRGTDQQSSEQASSSDENAEEKSASGGQSSASTSQSQANNNTAGQVPADVQAFLQDNRPASALSEDELRQRFRKARALMKTPGISSETRQSLQQMARGARLELQSHSQQTSAEEGGQATDSGEVTRDQTGEEQQQAGNVPAPGTIVPRDVLAVIKDPRPLSQLSDAEVRQRSNTIRNYLSNGKPPSGMRTRLQRLLRQTEQEQAKRGQQVGDRDNGQDQGGSGFNRDVEAKAQAFLNPERRAEELSILDLRQRLRDMRSLLGGNQLSRSTEESLRRQLDSERTVLRTRIASSDGKGGGNNSQAGSGQGGGNTNVNVTVILADTRDANLLDDVALRLRIDVFRDAVINVRYTESERARWRRIMERDRIILRERMLAQRRARLERLRNNNVNINIGINFDPGRPPPPDVFAAEVDDRQIEEVLVAPPRRKIERRYTVDEVADNPEIRDALPRVEIDTIHFGFGESYIREEEVENLDRIAEIMERILTAHPREVFMIEGHTDAVGSDASNLALSRQRAAAVMQALTTYYVIPPENLRTVGYGERFLKIPTPEAEVENRRVSIARATAVLGEAED